MGHKLDKGIEANSSADDAPSRRKSKGNDTLLPQRRVTIHDAGEKRASPDRGKERVFMGG